MGLTKTITGSLAWWTLLYSLLLTNTVAQTHFWQRTNPGGGGAFSTVGAGPSGIILAASDLSGTYMSNDHGATWTVIGASKGLTETHISGIGFHPSNANIFFIGTENGAFRTTDGGLTVNKVLSSGYITDIEIHTSGVGYLSRQQAWNSGVATIYKTTNNGLTWTQSSTNLPTNIHILKVIVKPDDANVVYLLTGNGRFFCGEADVYRSLNGGVSWTNLTPSLGSIMDIELDPHNFNNVYITTMEANCGAQYYWTSLLGNLYKSTNGGSSWGSPLSDYTGIIWPDQNNAQTIRLIDPREPWAWNPRSGTFTSTNGGISFIKTGDITNWDVFYNGSGSQFYCYSSSYNGIVMTLGKSMYNPSEIFWVNYQYIFKSSNQGTTFVNQFTNEISNGKWQSRGFDNVNTQDIEINKADPNILYAAYFDIGLWRSMDHGNSWESCNHPSYTGNWDGHGGNTSTVISDPVRSNIVWASMSGNQHGESPTYLVKSSSTGSKNSWQLSNSGLPTNDIMGLSLDNNSPSNSRILYVTANDDVYKSSNDGATWNLVYNCNGCKFTAVDPLNSNVVYAAGKNGVFKSTNAGSSWTNISHPDMPSSNGTNFWDYGYNGVFDLVTDPKLTDVVYVVVHGANKGLYRSTNQGSGWSKILTDQYLRKVAVLPQNSNSIYATSSSAYESGGYNSSSKGILLSLDNGANWTQHNNAMAYPFANAVAISTHPTQASVFIGSQGTGFQKSILPSQSLSLDQFSFQVIKTKDNTAIIKWKAPSNTEQELQYFVMYSKDNLQFEELFKTSNHDQLEEFTIESANPFEDLVYFKLEIKDKSDQIIKQSQIVPIRFESPKVKFNYELLQVNPHCSLHLTSNLKMQDLEIQIFNSQGQKLDCAIKEINSNTVQIDFRSSGLSFINIKNNQGQLLHNIKLISN